MTGPEALSGLPHGPAFRFIDAVTELVPGESARATFQLRGDEDFLRGHFPGEPLFPGVLMVEAIAQLAGVTFKALPGESPSDTLRLTAIRAAKILGTVGPGHCMEIQARILGRMGDLIQASGTMTSGGRELARCEVTLAIMRGGRP